MLGRVDVSVWETVALKSSANFFFNAFAKLWIEVVKVAI